ncbi:MAG: penicillin-binding protein activator [Candidatus Endonucleobacter bathymodioli]|uniref:Penicillin-binding protein activator n=1 Tax=Candidatus Endonucleibacter bathymodioli TaxID=539814 RepID=A0AA90SRT7_9GAMM|nr:penicillin-binding protein activator [Candidatus Endonucleobacter bathymodioli]
MRQKNIVHSLISMGLLALAALTVGCSSQIKPHADILQWRKLTDSRPQSADQFHTKVAVSAFADEVTQILKASLLLLDTDLSKAKTMLEPINFDSLTDELKEELALQQALIAYRSGQSEKVFEWLDRQVIFDSHNTETIARAHALRAKAYSYFAEYKAALDEWLGAMLLLTKEQQATYQNDIWKTMLHVPESRLRSLISQISEKNIQAWLQLAILYQPKHSIEQQLTGLKNWQQKWPNHPGNTYLPSNFITLESRSIKPNKIAILLPLSGSLAKAGRAVRDGIIAAHYEDLKKQIATTELLFFDTNGNDVRQLAEQAIQKGAQLIIGPLAKNDVSLIQNHITTQVPVLALNYIDSKSADPSSQFYQFGLSTEDEALMIAHRAILDGHKRAIMLTPKTPWGRQTNHYFSQAWKDVGGKMADHSEFDNNTQFSKLCGQLLHIDQSLQREKKLERLLKEPLNFQPRRRQDVDMIFIAASPAEARQIKPSLSYQFAENIPVYATSSVFSGREDPTKDRDIDGIRMPVMPWFIPSEVSDIKRSITDAWPHSQGEYGTLYALGSDAYKLHPKLEQLFKLQGSRLRGLTGWLSINQDLKIIRELTWQIFNNGRLRPHPVQLHEKNQANALEIKKHQSPG